jgi:aminomethyltransferase
MAEIGPNTRLRVSPFHSATVAAGAVAFSPYNRMLMPVSYGDPDAEYDRLLNGVAMWDVAVQRQVEIAGPDAARLAQILSARDLARCTEGQGRYVPLCDHRGVLLNDPVVLRLDADRFWFSIGDENVRLWARAIAAERGLDVSVEEPDVSPMAVQGPKATEVVAAVFGDWVRDLRLFGFRATGVAGIPVVVQRSGYSKQGGFEIYLCDGARGPALWDIVREAGRPWDIGPGNPNPVERIEGGLLSYGGDTDDRTDPFEVRLGKYVDLDLPDDVIGIPALRRIATEGPRRRQLGVLLDDTTRRVGHAVWYPVEKDGRRIGQMTNGGWSPRLGRVIGFVLVEATRKPGERVEILRAAERDAGTLVDLPFL